MKQEFCEAKFSHTNELYKLNKLYELINQSPNFIPI